MNLGRVIFEGVLIWVIILVQGSFIHSLSEPFSAFPLLLVWGLVILHERSLVWGTWWLVLAGFLLEIRGLGVGLTVVYALTAVVAVLLIRSVFAKRSLLGLFGVTIISSLAFLVLWLCSTIVVNAWYGEPLLLGVNPSALLFVLISVPMVVVSVSSFKRRVTNLLHRRVDTPALYDLPTHP